MWYKLLVLRVKDQHVLHVEEFERELRLEHTPLLLKMTYNDQGLKVTEMWSHLTKTGDPVDISVQTPSKATYEPKPGGWEMDQDHIPESEYHKAEYYAMGDKIHCNIIAPKKAEKPDFSDKKSEAEKATATVEVKGKENVGNDGDDKKVIGSDECQHDTKAATIVSADVVSTSTSIQGSEVSENVTKEEAKATNLTKSDTGHESNRADVLENPREMFTSCEPKVRGTEVVIATRAQRPMPAVIADGGAMRASECPGSVEKSVGGSMKPEECVESVEKKYGGSIKGQLRRMLPFGLAGILGGALGVAAVYVWARNK